MSLYLSSLGIYMKGGLVAPHTGSCMQISVGMKNFSMAIACMAGKCSTTSCLQASWSWCPPPGEYCASDFGTNLTVGSQLTQAEVLLKIDNVLGDHDGILNVGLNPLQALDALVTGVPAMKLAYKR